MPKRVGCRGVNTPPGGKFGTGCSFWRPSLGPTSRTEIWRGKSDIGGLVPGRNLLPARLTGLSLLLFPGQPGLLVLDQLEQRRLHVLDVRNLGEHQLAVLARRLHY